LAGSEFQIFGAGLKGMRAKLKTALCTIYYFLAILP